MKSIVLDEEIDGTVWVQAMYPVNGQPFIIENIKVNNQGEVRYIKPVPQSPTGKPLMSAFKGNEKYYTFRTRTRGEGQVRYKVSRCVLYSFNPCGDHDMVVDHINDDPLDDRLVNLHWVTMQYNQVSMKRKFRREGQDVKVSCATN